MSNKQLVRSSNDRVIAGVAGGIAQYINLDPTIVRLIFILLCFTASGGVFLYVILWMIMPSDEMEPMPVDDVDEEIIIEKSM